MKAILLFFTVCAIAHSEDLYLASANSGAADGTSCANARVYTWFNSSGNWGSGAGKISAGDTVHLCGTITAAEGAQALAFQASGSSGSPITLYFEADAILQSPRFAGSGGGVGCGGGICIFNRSYVVVDGGVNGIVRNTNNGDALTYNSYSVGIDGYSCTNCTVKNLSIINILVKTTTASTSPGDQTHAITMSGSGWLVENNIIHDCGWCIFQNFTNGDANIDIHGNDIYNMDHGWMLATAGANAATGPIEFHNNRVHDTANWDATGCAYHHDGIHTFGVSGSSIDGLSVYNNYFYGNWGSCPTGFIYFESGSSNPTHLRSWKVFNNVGVVGAGSGLNTNGWFGLFSGESGSQLVANNTIIGPNNTDNSICYSIQGMSGLTFKNNVVTNCGDPVGISSSTVSELDYNLYGTSCGNGGNCFIWNGSFLGSFAAWKSASGGDANAIQNNSPLLNADGTPQLSSPAIAAGANLTSLGITALNSDKSGIARPATGAWDIGAYQYQPGGPTVGISGKTSLSGKVSIK